MRIGVDLDGVMLEFQQRWAELYCEYFDAYIPYEALNSWDACIDKTHFESMNEFHDWFVRADGWNDMPWIAGSRGGIDKLIAGGHEVKFVTNRPFRPSICRDTIAQLKTLLPKAAGITHFVIDKSTVECDVYVDDSPAVIYDLANKNRKKVVVFDQPWNRHIAANALTPNLARATRWHEVIDIVNHYEKTGILTLPVKETA